MATETERKFLVRGEFRDKAIKKIEITQGYLSVDPLKTIRIRITGELELPPKSPGNLPSKSPKRGTLAVLKSFFSSPFGEAGMGNSQKRMEGAFDRGDKAYITIKNSSQQGKLSRGEWEYPLPANDARELMQLCLPGRVIKTRYIIPAGKHKFEVDVFHDKNEGLIIAEIELESEDEMFDKPEWLGEEVTGNPKYYSSNLIK